MPTFILTLNWTEQGIRGVKDAPKRSQAAKELAKKLGIELKHAYLTSGERPFIGNPGQEFQWFRLRESHFFQAVWRALVQLFS